MISTFECPQTDKQAGGQTLPSALSPCFAKATQSIERQSTSSIRKNKWLLVLTYASKSHCLICPHFLGHYRSKQTYEHDRHNILQCKYPQQRQELIRVQVHLTEACLQNWPQEKSCLWADIWSSLTWKKPDWQRSITFPFESLYALLGYLGCLSCATAFTNV